MTQRKEIPTMTCVCPAPASQIYGVPELKQLAELSRSQYVKENTMQNKCSNSYSGRISSPIYKHDSCDNNEKGKVSNREPLSQDSPIFYKMRYEANRLKSFENDWPLSFIRPEDCAAVGLFYLGEGDKVQCAFCRVIIASWDEGDKPLQEHVKHFPMCPYLLNRDVGNVPISGRNGHQTWQIINAHAERPHPIRLITQSKVMSSFSAKYPVMACFDKRLQTYSNWPPTSRMTPVDLAESGLFYSGVADVVTCFCCGGSMGNWNSGDVAWIEHAKHFPTCSFVKSTKGSAFIEEARKKFVSEHAATNCVQECMTPPVVPCSTGSAAAMNVENCVNVSEKLGPLTIKETEASSQENKFMCKICMEYGTRVALIPCGHSLACPSCAKELQVCPLCRSKIESVVRLYFD